MLRPGQRSGLMSVELSQESRLLRIDTSTVDQARSIALLLDLLTERGLA